MEQGGSHDVEALLRKLGSNDWYERCTAAAAFGDLGDRRATEPLVRALTDRDMSVRRQAPRALQALGDPAAVDGLVATLRGDSDSEVRAAAAWALGWLGDRAAVPALLEALLDDAEGTDSNALASLARLGEPVKPRLLAMLEDSDERVRASAAGLLSQQPAADLVEPLAAVLRDASYDVRWSAAYGLGKLGEAGLVKLLEAARDESPAVRATALMGIYAGAPRVVPQSAVPLGEGTAGFLAFGPLPAVQPVDTRRSAAVREGLQDPTAEVRRTAAHAAAELGLQEAAPLLVLLADDPDPGVSEGARHALARLGQADLLVDVRPEEAETLEGAMALLRHPNDAVRREAVRFLGQLGDARAARPLLRVLRDESLADAIDELEQVFARLGEPGLEALLEVAQESHQENEADWWLRARAMRALGAFGGERALEALLTLLQHEDARVRCAAATGLGRTGDARAIEPLRRAMADEATRRAAGSALVDLGDPAGLNEVIARVREWDFPTRAEREATKLIKLGERAIEPMAHALADPSESVQRLAKEVLCQLPHPRSVELLIQVLEKKVAPSLYGVEHCLIEMGELALEPLLAVLRDKASPGRDRAAYALGALRHPRAFEPLLRIAEDEEEDIDVRKSAVFFLGGFQDERAGPVLERLARGENESLRMHASGQLLRLGARADVLLAVVRDRTPAAINRGEAADRLAERRHPEAVAVLAGILMDPSDEMGTRVHAGQALGKLGRDALAVLTDALDRGDAVARRGAASGLGGVEAPEALAALERALGDPEHLVRSAAVGSLGQWLPRGGSERPLDLLLRALEDPHGVVRRSAVFALRESTDPRATVALGRAAEDPSSEVRRDAEQALDQRGEGGGLASLLRRVQAQERRARTELRNSPFT